MLLCLMSLVCYCIYLHVLQTEAQVVSLTSGTAHVGRVVCDQWKVHLQKYKCFLHYIITTVNSCTQQLSILEPGARGHINITDKSEFLTTPKVWPTVMSEEKTSATCGKQTTREPLRAGCKSVGDVNNLILLTVLLLSLLFLFLFCLFSPCLSRDRLSPTSSLPLSLVLFLLHT